MKRGVFLEKKNNDYQVHYGNFPNDYNRLCCSSNDENELIIKGVYKENKFENGYIIFNNNEVFVKKL